MKKKLIKALEKALRDGTLKDPSIISKVEMADEATLVEILSKTKDDLRQKIEDHIEDIHGIDSSAPDHKTLSDELHESAKQMPEHKTHDFVDSNGWDSYNSADTNDLISMAEWGHAHGEQGHKINVHQHDNGMTHIIAWKPRNGAKSPTAPAAKPTIPASNGQCTCPLNELMQSGCKCGAMRKAAQCTCPFNELMRNGCKCGAMQADRNEKAGKVAPKAETTPEPINNTTKAIPAAACGQCGGWTDMGGMSQHSKSKVPVQGRTGCTCGGAGQVGGAHNHLDAFRHHADHAIHFMVMALNHPRDAVGMKASSDNRGHLMMAMRHWAKAHSRKLIATNGQITLHPQDQPAFDADYSSRRGLGRPLSATDFQSHVADRNV